MNRAFTLFELVISLILFTLIASLLLEPLSNFYFLNLNVLKTNRLITQTHLSLLKIEKLIQNCTHISFSNHSLECFLKDELISLENNELYMINSALILENDKTLYLAKSDLKTLVQNRKDLYKDKERVIYALKNKQIKKISVLENNTVLSDFTGTFTPVQAKLIINLENEELNYELKPKFNKQLSQKGLLSKNITLFQIQNNKLKICLKEQTEYCLEKRLLI